MQQRKDNNQRVRHFHRGKGRETIQNVRKGEGGNKRIWRRRGGGRGKEEGGEATYISGGVRKKASVSY